MRDRDDLEQHLRAALQRKAPSGDFTQRVLERSRRQSRSPWRSFAAASVAASLLVGSLAVQQVQLRREQERGQAARAQVLQALQITSQTLHRIQQKLDGLNHD